MRERNIYGTISFLMKEPDLMFLIDDAAARAVAVNLRPSPCRFPVRGRPVCLPNSDKYKGFYSGKTSVLSRILLY
jgi:hypothetical protein